MNGFDSRKTWMRRIAPYITIGLVLFLILLGSGLIIKPANAYYRDDKPWNQRCGWSVRTPTGTVLLMDRSGSMLYDNPDRMFYIREAAKSYVMHLSTVTDDIGLMSFGYKGTISYPGTYSNVPHSDVNNTYHYPKTYSDYATVDVPLDGSFTTVMTALDNLVPDGGTPMRYGLKIAIDKVKVSPRENKTVILLSDGDYNWYGDPLARGTGYTYTGTDSHYTEGGTTYFKFSGLGSGTMSNQNLSRYAASNGVKIYTIAVATDITDKGMTTLQLLAAGSGGKYYYAPNPSELTAIYNAIAVEGTWHGGYCIRIQ